MNKLIKNKKNNKRFYRKLIENVRQLYKWMIRVMIYINISIKFCQIFTNKIIVWKYCSPIIIISNNFYNKLNYN
jgi:hypothetical protein